MKPISSNLAEIFVIFENYVTGISEILSKIVKDISHSSGIYKSKCFKCSVL